MCPLRREIAVFITPRALVTVRPYPGFGRTGGFLTSCVIMLVPAALLLWYLRKNR
ncbi:hypothetical protein ACPPVO_18550 [Dactylosporangium sp. McL0621]|uniref:hypothetical protein n=1 Tax=Dactylosporangium sp. McL0621 TaxID=3415678 RepID=UPI003CF83904